MGSLPGGICPGTPPGIYARVHLPGYMQPATLLATGTRRTTGCTEVAALRRTVTFLTFSDAPLTVRLRYRHPFHCWSMLGERHPDVQSPLDSFGRGRHDAQRARLPPIPVSLFANSLYVTSFSLSAHYEGIRRPCEPLCQHRSTPVSLSGSEKRVDIPVHGPERVRLET